MPALATHLPPLHKREEQEQLLQHQKQKGSFWGGQAGDVKGWVQNWGCVGVSGGRRHFAGCCVRMGVRVCYWVPVLCVYVCVGGGGGEGFDTLHPID